jgi:hypothetical protein
MTKNINLSVEEVTEASASFGKPLYDRESKVCKGRPKLIAA